MSDLIAFLNARLDGPGWRFEADFPTAYVRSATGAILADMLHADDEEAGPFIARHDPARTLREVEVKRAILAEHSPVRALAAVYSDRPDYSPEWAVTVGVPLARILDVALAAYREATETAAVNGTPVGGSQA